MNSAWDLLVFAGVMALVQFSPGPDMILMTRTALRQGVRAGTEMATGIACGLIVHSTLAVAGLALAFDRFPALRRLIGWAAAAYLLWLAYKILREVSATTGQGDPLAVPDDNPRPFLRGLSCNLLNPKAAIFMAAVSAPFLRGVRPDWWPLAIVGIVVVQGGVLWAVWSWLLQWRPLRNFYQRASRWIDLAFGLTLVALAGRLLYS